MNRDEALAKVKEIEDIDFLGEPVGRANGFNSYKCPFCGYSGSKDHPNTGLVRIPRSVPPRWKCFSCDQSADIVALWRCVYDKNNNKTYKEVFDGLYEHYGIHIDNSRTSNLSSYKDKQVGIQKKASIAKKSSTNDEKFKSQIDLIGYFIRCNANINLTSYHRGISIDILNRFKVGFDQYWTHPNWTNGYFPPSPRLIIPTSRYSYVARDVRKDEDISEKLKNRKKMNVGNKHIFNETALYSSTKPIFIVEGEIDALSVIEVGGEAIGLGGLGFRMLVELVKDKKPIQPLIIALDSDDAGVKRTKSLEEEFAKINIDYCKLKTEKWSDCYKDPNEWLMTDRESFKNKVFEETKLAIEKFAIQKVVEVNTQKDAEISMDSGNVNDSNSIENKNESRDIDEDCVACYVDSFFDDIKKNTIPPISTGFEDLDKILDGGLNAGLYVVGAVSSLGKTTFCLQIADNIAKSGRDVLIFSLEMARSELMAKSISRLTFLLDKKNGEKSKTTRGILKSGLYKLCDDEERTLLDDAMKCYKTYADHIYIIEGVGNVSSAKIRERVKNHIDATSRVPIVIVDYLQIIAPNIGDMRATDKQIVDRAVLNLKRLSRDYSTAVIAISSFNRDNYWQSVNLTSFKESGAIEYSSDVLIGLQYECMEYKEKENEENRKNRIRQAIEDITKNKSHKIQVKVLKNRNGSRGSINLDFFPMFNTFKKCENKNEDKKIKNGWVAIQSQESKK